MPTEPIISETLDEVEHLAISMSGCREAFDPYNPHDIGPSERFRRLWPRDQSMWRRLASAHLRAERKEK